MSLRTTIVIPAFNEERRLQAGYERLSPVLEQLDPATLEVVVVDDGSSDQTLKTAGSIYGHLPHNFFVQLPSNQGKGAAVRLGIALARGQQIYIADADMSIDPRGIITMQQTLSSCDLAPGSRAISGKIHYHSPLRTLAGRLFNGAVRHYTGATLADTQCGLKGFQSGVARLLALLGMVDRFAYDAEMLFLANELGLLVEPVPVEWNEVPGSTVNLRGDSLSMMRDIRALRATKYENPVVALPTGSDAEAILQLSREARVQGLVIARGESDDLVVLPRDGALGGLGIAAALQGTLRTAGLDELRGRHYEAI
jgi:glycosyltransferase involved in cell wall biosynthesis